MIKELTSCKCAAGSYYDKDSTSLCPSCPVTCATCTADNKCDTCVDGAIKSATDTNMCVCNTASGWFAEQVNAICTKCNANCKTCDGDEPTNCLSCA